MTILQKMINHRRYLHTIPELFFNEFKTTEYIENQLISMGYETKRLLDTGVVCFKKGTIGSKTYAFRSDIDALPIQEENNIPYKSTNENMHACGHDGHISILLGLAEFVSNIQTKENVLFIFQPAEEYVSGAKKLIDNGLFEKYPADAIFALHLMPSIDEHAIGLKFGPLMAMNADIDIEIIGKSSHGALPQNGIDSIHIASQLISSYQSIVSRSLSPMDQALISLTTIEGGNAKNIICDSVRIGGTIRTFKDSIMDNILSRIDNLNEGLEKSFGSKINCKITPRYKAVINNKNLYDMLYNNSSQFTVVEAEPTMIVEDFSFYQELVPGFLFLLGTKNEHKNYIYPLHNPRFDFNEEVLLTGLNFYKSILKLLNAL